MRCNSPKTPTKLQPALWITWLLIASGACSAEPGDEPTDAGPTFNAGTSSVAGIGGAFAASGAPARAGSAGSSDSTSGAPTAGGSTSFGGGAGSGSGGASSGAGGTAGSITGGGGANSAGSVGAEPQAGGSGAFGTAGAGNAFSPCPVNGTACAVLPLGDSITEGYGSSGGGYRVELFRQAVQNGKKLSFVGSSQNGPNTVANQAFPKKHEGHGGFTIDSGTGHSGISGPITAQAIANYHPNIVLLMVGTNDINGNIDVSTAPTRLGKLIDDITTRAPNALVVVATIIPVGNDGTNQKVKTYNAAIPGLVSVRAAAGKHVVLLDNYAAFSKDPNYRTKLMFDYLHPNDAGYALLGGAFYGALGAVLR